MKNTQKTKVKIHVFTYVNLIGFIITFMVGWVDAVSLLLLLGKRVAPMTGRFSKLALLLSGGEFRQAMALVLIITSFIVGSVVSTLITNKHGLLGGLSFAGFLLIISAFTGLESTINFAIITIPLATGSINAATSISDIGRTTHLTGAVTDIGISIANGNWNSVIFWSLRCLAFFLGVSVSLQLIDASNNNKISLASILLIPAITIILTGVFHRVVVRAKIVKEISKLIR